MISEQDFITNLMKYDPRGIEFDSLEDVNEIIKGAFRPISKRGIAPNEFTLVKLSGFEEVNKDTVIAMFDEIPPGPKELDRIRIHQIVGRYSQAIMLNIVIEVGNKKYLVLQERNPLCFGFKKSTEIFRDYISETDMKKVTENVTTEEDKLNIAKLVLEHYLNIHFKKILESALSYEIIPTGYFWENTGVLGCNTMSAIVSIKLDKKSSIEETILPLLNSDLLQNPANIIGKRVLILEDIKKIEDIYNLKTTLADEHFLNDMFSVTSLSILFKEFDTPYIDP